ncbi:MAG: STAS domain-containing protein [Planctomycetes bacterium]|nr:STAS domain-containing protein [Planctomycetota bacterium]
MRCGTLEQRHRPDSSMWSEYQHLIVRLAGDVLVIELIDPKLFDTTTVTQLQDELLLLVGTEQPNKAIVDFGRVVHCSTAVINGLLRAKKRVLANDGQLKLCGMTAGIRDAYKMLNLDGTVFQIHDTLDDAILAF